MSSERTPLRQHEESLVRREDSNFSEAFEAPLPQSTAAGGGLPLTNDSLACLGDNDDDDDDDAIDIEQLQEVAKRLDIPLSALLQQLRNQQEQDEEEGGVGGGACDGGDGSDEGIINGSCEGDLGSSPGSCPRSGAETPAVGPNGSGLSRRSEQHQYNMNAGHAAIYIPNFSGNSGRERGIGGGGGGGHNADVLSLASGAGGGSERKQIRIRGELADLLDDEAITVTSPLSRAQQQRFPNALSSRGGPQPYRGMAINYRGCGDDTASVGGGGGPSIRDRGRESTGGADSDGNESMRTAGPYASAPEDDSGEDGGNCPTDLSAGPATAAAATNGATISSAKPIQQKGITSGKTADALGTASPSNQSFYNNAQMPTKSALSKKASLASSGSNSAANPMRRGESRPSARRFGLGSGNGSNVGGSGSTNRSNGAGKTMRSVPSSGNMSQAGGGEAAPQQRKKGVRFGELQQVHVFEVDNSLYISIEYSRPLIGWVLLFVGVFLRVLMNTIDVYKLAEDPDAAYGFSTGRATGRAIVCLLIALPAWFFFVRPTRSEARFLATLGGAGLVLVTGVIFALSSVAQQSASRITGQWRPLAAYSLHPAIIVLYGKVFRNSVFVEELLGVAALAVGYSVAMVPTDIKVDKWYFAEILTFAQSIYVSSFLFLAVKARSNRVSVPVTMASVAFCSLAIQLIACAAARVPFDASSTHSAFEFIRGQYLGFFFACTICDVVSLACCLLALRFIPPLTVSTSWVVEPLLTQLVAQFLFFNKNSRVWNMCGEEDQTKNDGLRIFCGTNAFNPWFASGAFVAALATGYIIYISSIKRSKVEMLIKKLKRRKTPKNPYKPRNSDASSVGSGGGGGAYKQQQQQQLPPNSNAAAAQMQLRQYQQQQHAYQQQRRGSASASPPGGHQQQHYRTHSSGSSGGGYYNQPPPQGGGVIVSGRSSSGGGVAINNGSMGGSPTYGYGAVGGGRSGHGSGPNTPTHRGGVGSAPHSFHGYPQQAYPQQQGGGGRRSTSNVYPTGQIYGSPKRHSAPNGQ